MRLKFYLLHRSGLARPEKIILRPLDEREWTTLLAALRVGFDEEFKDQNPPAPDQNAFDRYRRTLKDSKEAMIFMVPRGIGPGAWGTDPGDDIKIRRRFVALGQTLDGMRVWDVCRSIQAVRSLAPLQNAPLEMQAVGRMAGIALYASLFEPGIARLDLQDLPASHRNGPFLLNVLRYLDISQALALAAERCQVRLYRATDNQREFPKEVVKAMDWPANRFQVSADAIRTEP